MFELTGTEHCQQTIVAKFIDRMVNTRVNFYESVYAGKLLNVKIRTTLS